jgi:hypothetical protein
MYPYPAQQNKLIKLKEKIKRNQLKCCGGSE